MKISPLLPSLLFIASLQAPSASAADATADGQAPAPLSAEISALDTQVFDAFNHCAEPGRLDQHASYFSPDVEFYHDTGGVTWTREQMIANTSKYVCGNFTRELVPGTLKVYPVKDFGAISQGVHRFCQLASGQCEGLADFVIVWHRQEGQWWITRVLSYGHRAAVDAR
ncbi:MAG: nuclear transport factor 2 family protein [Pseudoxanthomonas sp.]